MYLFLDLEYQRCKSDDIGGLLSTMSYLQDGEPLDSALWGDWMKSVERVLTERLTRTSSKVLFKPHE